MLSDALEFEELWEGRDSLLLALTERLRVGWFEKYYSVVKDFPIHELSGEALEFLLSKRKLSRLGKGKSQSVQEYLVLRQIVECLVHQNLPTSDEEVSKKLQEILPIEESVDLLWQTIAIDKYPMSTGEIPWTSSKVSGSHYPTRVLNSRLGSDIRKEPLERLLKYIDWCRIPAIVLLKVIHPLELISPHAFSEALACHVLHRSVNCFSVQKWKCSEFVSFYSDGEICCQSEDDVRSAGGRAIAILPMTRSCGTYEWNLHLVEDDADDILVGIISGSDNAPWEKYDLEVRSLASCPATKLLMLKWGVGISSMQGSLPDRELIGWEEYRDKHLFNCRLTFTLDRLANTCLVRINDTFLIMWNALPDAVFHPVIETVRAKCVRATIEACRGFHCL